MSRESRVRWSPFVVVAGFVLGACGEAEPPPLGPASGPGEARFRATCGICHGARGTGVVRGVPSLVGSEWVRGSETRLIRLTMHGLEGPKDVDGKPVNLAMPGVGQSMSDEQIAELLTFVRERFGAPSAPIAAATVARVRAEDPLRARYWTEEELRQTE